MMARWDRNVPIDLNFYLVCVDNNFALFLVSSCDDKHVIEAWGVVDDTLVLVCGQHVPGPGLQQVHTSLINSQPQVLGPVRREGLLN